MDCSPLSALSRPVAQARQIGGKGIVELRKVSPNDVDVERGEGSLTRFDRQGQSGRRPESKDPRRPVAALRRGSGQCHARGRHEMDLGAPLTTTAARRVHTPARKRALAVQSVSLWDPRTTGALPPVNACPSPFQVSASRVPATGASLCRRGVRGSCAPAHDTSRAT
jgi:hypothetical protein